jgi:hypothetical protein
VVILESDDFDVMRMFVAKVGVDSARHAGMQQMHLVSGFYTESFGPNPSRSALV